MMKKTLIAVSLAIVLSFATFAIGGLDVTDVDAKVHPVSQAGCAHDPALSGGNQSGDNSPAAPIPVTASAQGEAASEGKASAGSGGDGDAACDTPAATSGQD
jgi:hypothetical protein